MADKDKDTSNAPIGGAIEKLLRDQADNVNATDVPGHARGWGQSGYGVDPGAARTAADVVHAVGKAFYGDQEQPGILGGSRRVGDPYQMNQEAFNIPGYSNWQGQLGQGAADATGRNSLNMGDANASRNAQSALMQQLQQQARGEGPSVAQAQLRQASEENMSNAAAMAASGRGPGAGGAAYQAANQQANIGQKMAGDSAMLRMQEQQQAQGQLANLSGQMRGQDLSTQTIGLQQQAQNDDLVKFYVQSGLSLDQAQQQAKQSLEESRMKQQLETEKLKNDAYAAGKLF